MVMVLVRDMEVKCTESTEFEHVPFFQGWAGGWRGDVGDVIVVGFPF